MKFIAKIGKQFGVRISQKAAAQAVPAIGAVGGALVNTLFMSHFQDMARGHFVMRKLERKYDKEMVKNYYLTLSETISD